VPWRVLVREDPALEDPARRSTAPGSAAREDPARGSTAPGSATREDPARGTTAREAGADALPAGAPDPALRHVLLLARERGVPVEPVADLPYRCVGLIQPRFGRAGE
jgi:hypothetical protein